LQYFLNKYCVSTVVDKDGYKVSQIKTHKILGRMMRSFMWNQLLISKNLLMRSNPLPL